ncbi:hypothetical protein [Hugenholtzia roseola]|uniref:hypothetical protein n=1 Tax=Hugenholtzia roseola TaxID=1002 RepID=UPI0012B623A7|nr:hypothetical protein [Hugenholtzia roseola]
MAHLSRFVAWLIFWTLFSNLAQAQEENPKDKKSPSPLEWLESRMESYQTDIWQADTSQSHVILIPMGFGKSDPKLRIDWNALEGEMIDSIVVVYTDYPKGKDLSALNRKRLSAILAHDESLATQEFITWRSAAQTEGKTAADFRKRFHGLAVYVRKKSPSGSPILSDSELNSPLLVDKLIDMRYVSKDSTFFKVMKRNKEWDNILVVNDWTGSMYPYGVQVLVWHALQSEKSSQNILQYVFFNDGNLTPDKKKVAGKVGGIYFSNKGNFESAKDAISKTIMSGNGGDIQENDLEAVLAGLEKCPECEQVVLVADSYAPVRDLVLLDQIKAYNKPLRIVLCGAEANGISPDYLKIASETGGSLHFIESDIITLAPFQNGETFELADCTYVYQNGSFLLTGCKEGTPLLKLYKEK